MITLKRNPSRVISVTSSFASSPVYFFLSLGTSSKHRKPHYSALKEVYPRKVMIVYDHLWPSLRNNKKSTAGRRKGSKSMKMR